MSKNAWIKVPPKGYETGSYSNSSKQEHLAWRHQHFNAWPAAQYSRVGDRKRSSKWHVCQRADLGCLFPAAPRVEDTPSNACLTRGDAGNTLAGGGQRHDLSGERLCSGRFPFDSRLPFVGGGALSALPRLPAYQFRPFLPWMKMPIWGDGNLRGFQPATGSDSYGGLARSGHPFPDYCHRWLLRSDRELVL